MTLMRAETAEWLASGKCEQFTRALFDQVELRAVDDESRMATFVAATESGVETWAGREHLKMSGADLKRYQRNPVVLDTHNRWTAGGIIGKAAVAVKGRELIAEVTFAETARAEEIWQLVRGRFLNALSVGFLPRDTQVIAEEESAKLGKQTIKGPARIVKEWELYEISVVPVPADAEALRRSFLHGESVELATEVRSLVRALDRIVNKESDVKDDPSKEAPDKTADADKDKAGERSAPVTAATPEPIAEEILARQIRAVCPRGLEALADTCITEGLPLEQARKRMLEEHAKQAASVGTSEPDVAASERGAGADDVPELKDVSDDMLARSLCG